MKHFRAILWTGLALEAPALLILFLFASAPVTTQATVSLDPGTDSYGLLAVDLSGGSPISGTFETTSGNDVLFMVLDEGQFADYVAGNSYNSRFSDISSSGSFSIDQVDMERCYFVIEHAVEFSSTEETKVTYEVPGIDLAALAFAMVVMVVSGSLVMYAIYTRNKERTDARIASTKYLDVTFFDDEPKR